MGFEQFGLRVQESCQLVQFTLVRKGYDNHHCHNKPQTGNGTGVWLASCPEDMGWEFGIFWKKIQLKSDHCVEKLEFDHAVEGWHWTMQADSWVSAIGAENFSLCHWVEFSTVAAAVKFCRSRPAKINWDLKHHEMCRSSGVLLA